MPIGTVPIYEAISRVKRVEDLNKNVMLEVIEEQAQQGVDYMTIHAGVLIQYLPMVSKRITGIVSRGGAILGQWMAYHHKQNFLYECFEDICKIFAKYDVSFSLGDGLRPGCLADASDEAQFAELKTLGELTRIAWKYDVQVMIEGPGHIPMHKIKEQVEKENELVRRSSVLHPGPAGHRHSSRLRPHHLRHRSGHDRLVRRVDALLRNSERAPGLAQRKRRKRRNHRLQNRRPRRRHSPPRPGARDRDDALSYARYKFDWEKQFELSLDPETARSMHDETLPEEGYKTAAFCSHVRPEVLLDELLQ